MLLTWHELREPVGAREMFFSIHLISDSKALLRCEAPKCKYNLCLDSENCSHRNPELLSVSLQSLPGRTCSKAHLQQEKRSDSF
ncbi:hypothetical protein Nmel_011327 [Mimus melanotis]